MLLYQPRGLSIFNLFERPIAKSELLLIINDVIINLYSLTYNTISCSEGGGGCRKCNCRNLFPGIYRW